MSIINMHNMEQRQIIVSIAKHSSQLDWVLLTLETSAARIYALFLKEKVVPPTLKFINWNNKIPGGGHKPLHTNWDHTTGDIKVAPDVGKPCPTTKQRALMFRGQLSSEWNATSCKSNRDKFMYTMLTTFCYQQLKYI